MLDQKELQIITDAIQEAEKMTSGEIRVCIARSCKGNPLEAAVKKFDKLEMYKTEQRNGVLIYVAPNDKKVAIYGDVGINDNTNSNFWDTVLAEMLESFSRGMFIDGLIHAVGRVGELIKNLYPIQEGDKNELCNDVICDVEE